MIPSVVFDGRNHTQADYPATSSVHRDPHSSGTSMVFVRLVAPEKRVTSLARTPSAAATAFSAAAVARPSTAGSPTATINASSP